MSLLKSYVKETAGNMTILFVSVASMIGIGVGAAVDLGRVVSADQKLQDAVDAATLYAATIASEDDFEAAALHFLNYEIEELGLKDLSASFDNQDGRISGSAKGGVKLQFAGFIAKDFSNVSATSIVSVSSKAPPCIILLNKTTSTGLLMNSGSYLESDTCGVDIHSEQDRALSVNSDAVLDVPITCVAGGAGINGNGLVVALETGCTPLDDPYVEAIGTVDTDGCDVSNKNYDNSTVTLSPGTYCGWFNFNNSNGTVDMEPGLYVLKNGGWNSNGQTWRGDGVTFYFADNSRLQFNSNVEVDFSAPKSGPYSGFLMDEAPGLNGSSFVLNDSLGFDFEGIIHLPSRNITLNSGSTLNSSDIFIVADRMIVNDVQIDVEAPDGFKVTRTEPYLAQ